MAVKFMFLINPILIFIINNTTNENSYKRKIYFKIIAMIKTTKKELRNLVESMVSRRLDKEYSRKRLLESDSPSDMWAREKRLHKNNGNYNELSDADDADSVELSPSDPKIKLTESWLSDLYRFHKKTGIGPKTMKSLLKKTYNVL